MKFEEDVEAQGSGKYDELFYVKNRTNQSTLEAHKKIIVTLIERVAEMRIQLDELRALLPASPSRKKKRTSSHEATPFD